MTYPLLLVFVTGALLIRSCKEHPQPPKDQVCVYVGNDTDTTNHHYIPKDSIRIYRGDFDRLRKKLDEKFPNLSISDCETFSKRSIASVLGDSVVGLKIYYGIRPSKDSTGKRSLRLIIVGVDSKGRDVYIPNPHPGPGKKARAVAGAPDPQGGDDGGLEYGQCDPPCTN